MSNLRPSRPQNEGERFMAGCLVGVVLGVVLWLLLLALLVWVL